MHQPLTELYGGRPNSPKTDNLEILESFYRDILTRTEHEITSKDFDDLLTFFEVRVPQLFAEVRYLRDEFFRLRKTRRFIDRKHSVSNSQKSVDE